MTKFRSSFGEWKERKRDDYGEQWHASTEVKSDGTDRVLRFRAPSLDLPSPKSPSSNHRRSDSNSSAGSPHAAAGPASARNSIVGSSGISMINEANENENENENEGEDGDSGISMINEANENENENENEGEDGDGQERSKPKRPPIQPPQTIAMSISSHSDDEDDDEIHPEDYVD